jgi:integrase
LRAPKVPESETQVISDEQIRGLLKLVEGNNFFGRRNTAILLVLLDTGVRHAELHAMRMEDVDLKERTITIPLGKGRKPRVVFLGKKSARALDRYLLIRDTLKHADSEFLWLSYHGRLAYSTIGFLLYRLCKDAGYTHIYPHLFRHTFADKWLEAGGQEGDLKTIGGWSSDAVMRRYGKTRARERARGAHRQFSPADRL